MLVGKTVSFYTSVQQVRPMEVKYSDIDILANIHAFLAMIKHLEICNRGGIIYSKTKKLYCIK